MEQFKAMAASWATQLCGWSFGCLDDRQSESKRFGNGHSGWIVPILARWANPKDSHSA
jgi:hypothetical protein